MSNDDEREEAKRQQARLLARKDPKLKPQLHNGHSSVTDAHPAPRNLREQEGGEYQQRARQLLLATERASPQQQEEEEELGQRYSARMRGFGLVSPGQLSELRAARSRPFSAPDRKVSLDYTIRSCCDTRQGRMHADARLVSFDINPLVRAA